MVAVPRIALTPGEPAGIGLDTTVRIAQQAQSCELVAIADRQALAARARRLGLELALDEVDYDREPAATPAGRLSIEPLACAAMPEPGCLNPDNAFYVLATLDRAVERCRAGDCAALVTGPVHKAVINAAGVAFSGHTDWLAARCGGADPVMMLTTDDGALRVALATVHIPLAAVPAALTAARLEHVLSVTERELRARFAIPAPRILVAGLNPHAGEDGYLGREEIDVIAPVIRRLAAAGSRVCGPLPADTLFTPARLADADAVVAMYHDQGLPVIKHLGFGRTVNVSLGLPIVRTSVDHGTALSLAGRAGVDSGSLRAAIATALAMTRAGRGA